MMDDTYWVHHMGNTRFIIVHGHIESHVDETTKSIVILSPKQPRKQVAAIQIQVHLSPVFFTEQFTQETEENANRSHLVRCDPLFTLRWRSYDALTCNNESL